MKALDLLNEELQGLLCDTSIKVQAANIYHEGDVMAALVFNGARFENDDEKGELRLVPGKNLTTKGKVSE